jgi:hypothetical protein
LDLHINRAKFKPSGVTEEEKQQICQLTQLGLVVGAICRQFNLHFNSQEMYNIRRKTLKEMRVNEIDRLMSELQTWKNWNFEIKVKHKVFQCMLAVNQNVVSQPFATEANVIDDTAKIFHFEIPLKQSFQVHKSFIITSIFTLLSNRSWTIQIFKMCSER